MPRLWGDWNLGVIPTVVAPTVRSGYVPRLWGDWNDFAPRFMVKFSASLDMCPDYEGIETCESLRSCFLSFVWICAPTMRGLKLTLFFLTLSKSNRSGYVPRLWGDWNCKGCTPVGTCSVRLDMCPDYEGIETIVSWSWNLKVLGGLDMCPDYEGIETFPLLYLYNYQFVWICAPTMRGLKLGPY